MAETSTPATTAPGRVPRGVLLVAAAIVVIAAVLRLWNIDSGIPNNVGQDEPHVMDRVVRMMKTGDFNPHFFDWPTLTFYLNLIVSTGVFMFGAMRGWWSHLDQISADQLYLSGRVFTALIGTATVAVTFAAGRRWGTGVALFAGAFMAVMPNHVRESHYVLTDVPTAFFTTLTLLLALRATERRTTWSIAAAGLAAGLAASCKYNGGMAVIFALIAAVEVGGGWRLVGRHVLIAAGAAGAGFLVGTPYALLDMPAFMNDYARLAAVFARDRDGEPGWSIYLKHIVNSVGQPAFVGMAVGLLAVAFGGLRRASERGRALMVISFVVIYFFVMAGSFQIYARYLLPLLPLLSIACGVGVVGVVGWVRGRVTGRLVPQLVGASLAVLILAIPTVSAVQYGRGLAVQSTIALAYEWIVTNVPDGSTVAIEYGAFRLPKRYRTAGARLLVTRTIDDYRADGVDYFVATAPEYQQVLRNPDADPSLTMRYRALLESTQEVASFDPSASIAGPPVRIFRLVR